MTPFVHDDRDADTTISRPVTDRSRITGTSPMAQPSGVPFMIRETHAIDWSALVASVISGLAVTATLVILGMSTGLIAGGNDTSADGAKAILASMGAWTVLAAIIGSFVGSLLGGRLARWMDRGSIAYHSLASWGLATLLSILLVTMVAIGFSSAATSAAAGAVAADAATTDTTGTSGAANGSAGAASNEPDATGGDSAAKDTNSGSGSATSESNQNAADDAADALGGAGVALTLGMLLTLAASFAGWWVGSRKRLTDFEREDAEVGTVAV